jgi:hypothetical protein
VSRSQLRQQAASRVEGLNEDDIRVRREDGEVVAEPETEALAQQVREDVRQRESVDAEDSISVTVRRGEDGEIRTRAEVTPAEPEQELTADTPTGRTIEKTLDPITEPLSRGAQELAEKVRETPLPTTRPEAALLNTKLQNDDPGPISRVASGGVEAVGDAARLPEAAIRVSEDAAAITGPALRAGTPIEPGDAGPTEEALETAQQETEDVPGQVRTAAVRTGEFAAENPLRFAGQLAVGAAVGGAATRGLSRAGVPVERIPSAGEVTGRATRQVTGKATQAASDAVERAAPVARRKLEAAGVDVDRLTPLRRQAQTVGTVSRPARSVTRFRKMRRMGPDADEADAAEPDVVAFAGERSPLGGPEQSPTPRIQTTARGFEGGDPPDIKTDEFTTDPREIGPEEGVKGDTTQRGTVEEVTTGTQKQTTLDSGEFEVEVTEERVRPADPIPEAQGEAFLARPGMALEETRRGVEGGDADITTRGDVGTRAEVGSDDFGGGEGATVEAQTGQTGIPAVALELEKPGLLGRVLGRDTDLRVRGEVPDEATQAAVGRILAEYRRKTDKGAVVNEGGTRAKARVRGEGAQAQLLSGEGRTTETRSTGTSPEAAAREAITESDVGEFTDRGRLADVTEFDDADTTKRDPSDAGAEAGGLTPAVEGEVTPLTEGENVETTTVETEIRPETPSEVGETAAVIGEDEPAEIDPLGEFGSRETDVIQAERPSERDDGIRPVPLTGVAESTAVTPAVESTVRTANDTATDTTTGQDTRVTAAATETTDTEGTLRFTELRTPPEREFVPGDDDEDELFLDGGDEDGRGGITEQQFLADLAGPGEVLRGDVERQELDESDAGFVFGG